MVKNGMPDGVKSSIAWVLGVGIIAFILVIMVIIFGNLSGNVGFDSTTTTYVNQSTGPYAINVSTYILTNGISTNGFHSLEVTLIHNASGFIIDSNNYTVDATAGTIVGGLQVLNYSSVNVSYVVTHKDTPELEAESIIGNYANPTDLEREKRLKR